LKKIFKRENITICFKPTSYKSVLRTGLVTYTTKYYIERIDGKMTDNCDSL